MLADVDPEWERYHGAGCSTCVGSGSDCWCNAITGFTRCACQGGYIDQLGDCVQPCLRTVCTHGQFYCRPTFQGISYECKCYTAEPRCNIKRVIDCTRGTCQNGGTCFDGKNQYACVCLQGFWGANCEINENECHYPNICPNNAHCQDDVNSYKCVDSSGRQVPVIVPSPATYFPQPNYTPAPATQAPRIPATPSPSIPATQAPWIPPTPAPGTPPTPAPRTPAPPVTIYPNKGVPTPAGPALTSHWTNLPTQKSTTLIPAVGRDGSAVAATSGGFLETLNDDQRLLLTVVPPAGIGFIVLLIGIGTLIYVLRKKSNRNQGDLSGVTETTSIASHNPSLVTFDSKCYTDEGTPGPPKMPKAVEADSKRVSYGEFDDVLYGNEALQRGMEEWYSYILELYHNQGLNRILIIRLDGEKWVLSPGSKLYMDEVEAIFNLLSKKMIQGTFKVQGREFGIVGNTDFVIMAHTFRNSKRAQEILCATKTRQFVIIGTADFSSDGGRCKEKVLELRDHIKVQGL